MPPPTRPTAQTGISLIEVLVTVVVIAIGILGLVGLQGRMQIAEMEAYQRSQALVLLNDMASRLGTNRTNAASYVTSAPVGTGDTCTVTGTSSRSARDVCEWSNALQGAAETAGSSKVGAFLGGRGCIEDLGNSVYMITVAWQGMGPVSAPPASVTCGQGNYDGGVCSNDLCRRTMTTVVSFGAL